MLKELKKNKMSVMSVVATGILFGVMGVLIIPMIAVIVKISNALSQKHPRIYKQRCTRGYKRYKETSGLIEWKECQIFHSIFT